MWNLPQPGIKPPYPALAGGFWPTVPPGKSWFLQILHPKSKMLPKGHNNGYGEVTSIKPNSHNWYHHLSRPQAHSATPRDWAHVCEQGVRKRSSLSRLHLVPPAIPALGGGEAPPGEPGKGCNSSNEGPAPAEEVPLRPPRPCVFAGFRVRRGPAPSRALCAPASAPPPTRVRLGLRPLALRPACAPGQVGCPAFVSGQLGSWAPSGVGYLCCELGTVWGFRQSGHRFSVWARTPWECSSWWGGVSSRLLGSGLSWSHFFCPFR